MENNMFNVQNWLCKMSKPKSVLSRKWKWFCVIAFRAGNRKKKGERKQYYFLFPLRIDYGPTPIHPFTLPLWEEHNSMKSSLHLLEDFLINCKNTAASFRRPQLPPIEIGTCCLASSDIYRHQSCIPIFRLFYSKSFKLFQHFLNTPACLMSFLLTYSVILAFIMANTKKIINKLWSTFQMWESNVQLYKFSKKPSPSLSLVLLAVSSC